MLAVFFFFFFFLLLHIYCHCSCSFVSNFCAAGFNAASHFYCFLYGFNYLPANISPRWLKINHLEIVAFSSLIFFCMNFESKCTVLGTTV